MRQVAAIFLESTLQHGTTLEQFMADTPEGGEKLIRWVELVPKPAGIEVWAYSVPDLGDECLDGPDPGDAEPRPVAVVADPRQALEFAQTRFGARQDNWVNQGVSRGELIDLLRTGRRSTR